MKKSIAILSIAALLLTINVAAAKDSRSDDNSKRDKVRINSELKSNLKFNLLGKHKDNRDGNNFVAVGTIASKANSTLTLTVQADNRADISGTVTVLLNSETRIEARGDDDTLAGLAVGDRVVVKGEKEDSGFMASRVHVIGDKEVKAKAAGEVTAVSDTSITIKNNVSGEQTTLIITPDTEVQVNGETSTVADIEVGDKGWVKFKAKVDTMVASVVKLFR